MSERTTEHIPIVNGTELVAWTVPGAVGRARTVTLVVKGTWDLPTGALSDDQRYPSGDVRVGDAHQDDGMAALSYASDFAPFKPRADVTLHGYGYAAPGEKRAGVVELQLGELRARVAVFGPRTWGIAGQGEPQQFDRVLMDHRAAFGGEGIAANPAGCGRVDKLPQLEDPERLMVSASSTPQPVCFAPIAAEWEARKRHLGTYDRAWLKEHWPFFPGDFDWSYFNAAPKQLQVDYLTGNEAFRLSGVLPEAEVVTGQLPGRNVTAFARHTESGELRRLSMHLDTVHFDTCAMELVMLWRGVVAEENATDGAELATLFVLDHPVGDEPPLAQVEQLEQLAEREASARDAEEEPELFEPPPAPKVISRQEVIGLLKEGGSLQDVDWAGADLSQLDLSGRDLRGALLSGANLANVDFSNACLVDAQLDGVTGQFANFRNADLSQADLSESELDRSNFGRAVLTAANLTKASLNHAVLSQAQASQSVWAEVDAERAVFDNADLSGADFSGATLTACSFRQANLADAMLYDAKCDWASFRETVLDDLRADDASLQNAGFEQATGQGASFENALLQHATLKSARLGGVNFARANLRSAQVLGSELSGAVLRKADAREVDFRGSNLMRSDFQDAHLTGADLRGCNLYEAETWGANVDGVKLEGALVSGTKLEGAR